MDPKETEFYNTILIVAVVIGAIMLYFIFSILQQQRRHNLLYKEKLVAEINTLEKERIRIMADLHDELGPTLSAAKFKLSSIEILEPADEKLRNDAMQYIDSILAKIRSIANDLMSTELLRNGLAAAITELAQHMSANSSMQVLVTKKELPVLPQNYQVHIYRIIQEIMLNSVKHAEATRLRVEIYSIKNTLTIATADNGKGFHAKKTKRQNTGIGMLNLQNRTDMLSGKLFLSSKPGQGTSILIEIPLPIKS